MAEKLVSSAVFIVGMAAAYGWMRLRVHVLRQAGAEKEARRRSVWYSWVFGGTLLLLLITTWVPRAALGWVGGLGMVILFGGVAVLISRQLREARQDRLQGQRDAL